jgi:DNA polymerase-3 subunit delta
VVSKPTKTSSKEPKGEGVVTAFQFLDRTQQAELPVVVAAFGPDDFLRRRALHHAIALGGLDETTIRTFEGDEAQWRDVHDELATRSLFDTEGRRAAKLRGGDGFVSANRDALERWLNKATVGSTLLLDLRTLASNTNLYKQIRKVGWLISAAEVKDAELLDWILCWGQKRHSLYLTRPQGEVLVDRIGPVCGLIDCELAKLALFANAQGGVSDDRVHEVVGGWRTQTVWNLADWVAEAKIDQALEAIDKLVMAGQSAFGIAAQLSWSLRRYGTAAHLIEQMERMGQRPNLQQALERAGFRPFDIAKAEIRLRTIGRGRAKELLSWLVELEMQLKGSHSNEDRARQALESFLLRLCNFKPTPVRNAS